MLARLHHASSRLLAPARLHNATRLRFSNSAVVAARITPGRSARRNEDDDDDKVAPAGRSFKAAKDFEFGEEDEEDDKIDEAMFDFGEEEPSEEDGEGEGEEKHYDTPFDKFKEEIAPQYRDPKPRNWLHEDRPFPLNVTFKPPTPLSDAFRSRLYRSYLADPEVNSVRALAARYNIGIKRVDAILRLKGMEETWKKDHQLQTGFQAGMERLLGVGKKQRKEDSDEFVPAYLRIDPREESNEADKQADVEKARQRYQRLFWEHVEEGKEPVMPGILEAAQGSSRTTYKGKTTLVDRAPGRPAIKFIDVGDAFVDEKEKARREREGARRSALKAKKKEKQALRA